MKYSQYDIVIVGTGLAGLYLANKLSEEGDFDSGILLITKNDQLVSGSTSLAQGGIVSVIPELNESDSIESHIKDTIISGCGLNNINTVKYVSENSYIAIQELMKFGVEFDRDSNSKLNFTLEGAHSHPRILHSGGDSTGYVISKVLSERIADSKNVDIYKNCMAIEILTDNNNTCHGIISYNTQTAEYEVIYSNNVIIATGGIGQIYLNSTNPSVSTGDGIAIASKAGAQVENMEFVQFHPTALYTNGATNPLVSESVRGEGAKLVNTEGEYFAKKYHQMADLAPRDVVARAILNEMEVTKKDYVNLDISQIGLENFKKRFPTVTRLCMENNVDISDMLIPVVPVQHYFMGGIKVDLDSKTSVKNLYAIGECASTGLHGANRLASNSLLECAVFAQRLATNLIQNKNSAPKMFDESIKEKIDRYSNIADEIFEEENYDDIFLKLKHLMTQYVGISRNEEGLLYALNELNKLETNVKFAYSHTGFELINAIHVSKLITLAAIKRKESIGAHFRSDSAEIATKTVEYKDYDYDKLLA